VPSVPPRSVPLARGGAIAVVIALLLGSIASTATAVELSDLDDDRDRVFPGLTRQLTADRERGVQWRATPADLARVDGQGLVRARRTGTVTVTAQAAGLRDQVELTVLGELEQLVAAPSRIELETRGDAASLRLVGRDADGYRAPIEPRDASLTYDQDVIDVTATTAGWQVTARAAEGGTPLTLRVGDEEVSLAVTIGASQEVLDDLTSLDGWTSPAARATAELFLSEDQAGRDAVGLRYDFDGEPGTAAAYLRSVSGVELAGEPSRIGMFVLGDGNGAWLRMNVIDDAGQMHVMNLAPEITWRDWRFVEAAVPEGVRYPIRFHQVYPVEVDPNADYAGELVFSDLTVTQPSPVVVPEPPRREDPLVLQDERLGDERWTFAVMGDTEFSASGGENANLRLARESLREIRAEDPDLLIIKGDLIDTGLPEDFALANRVLDEELGDDVAYHWMPGNHETYGTDSLDNFRTYVGDTWSIFDHRRNRFVLLNSAFGTLEGSDPGQLDALETTLDEAATDDEVDNVVVMAHHSTYDPNPQDASRLADRREIARIEAALTGFREASGGKGAVFLAGHAHVSEWRRHDGVPYVVLPPAGAKIYGATDRGGFTAWTLFGVDPDARPRAVGRRHETAMQRSADHWLRAEVRPVLDGIELDAPAELKVGETGVVRGTGLLSLGRTMPLRYPATVHWDGSEGLVIGTGELLVDEVRAAGATAALDRSTGELTALAPGTVELRVTAGTSTTTTEVVIRP
jgi:3',5'-cyclic AMP phosphodiesterase CpdA